MIVYIIYSTEDCVYEGVEIKAGDAIYVGATSRSFKQKLRDKNKLYIFFKNYRWSYYIIQIDCSKKELILIKKSLYKILKEPYIIFNETKAKGKPKSEEHTKNRIESKIGSGKYYIIQHLQTGEILKLKNNELDDVEIPGKKKGLCPGNLQRTLYNVSAKHKGFILLRYEYED